MPVKTDLMILGALVLGFIIGLVIGYFFWSKKTNKSGVLNIDLDGRKDICRMVLEEPLVDIAEKNFVIFEVKKAKLESFDDY